MNIDIEVIRAMREDYIKYECGIHGGTGTNLLYCDGTRSGHDEFAEWIIDGFPALIAEAERLKVERDAAMEDIYASANDPYHCGICKKRHIKCEANPDGSCQFEWRGERSE